MSLSLPLTRRDAGWNSDAYINNNNNNNNSIGNDNDNDNCCNTRRVQNV